MTSPDLYLGQKIPTCQGSLTIAAPPFERKGSTIFDTSGFFYLKHEDGHTSHFRSQETSEPLRPDVRMSDKLKQGLSERQLSDLTWQLKSTYDMIAVSTYNSVTSSA